MNVVNLNELRGQTTALASIVRVGDFNQQFGNYHSLNLLPGKRAVIDAYNVSRQKDLIQELRANGYELILDTKGAELACPFKWSGQARKAEWLEDGIQRALAADSFNENMASKIAQLAIAGKFHVVLVEFHRAFNLTWSRRRNFQVNELSQKLANRFNVVSAIRVAS